MESGAIISTEVRCNALVKLRRAIEKERGLWTDVFYHDCYHSALQTPDLLNEFQLVIFYHPSPCALLDQVHCFYLYTDIKKWHEVGCNTSLETRTFQNTFTALLYSQASEFYEGGFTKLNVLGYK